MTFFDSVPQFLQGTWHRRYIRRAIAEDGSLGPPNTAPVRYIQTPHAFIDVRPWHADDGTSSTMAFAGVTTTSVTLPPGAGSWASGSSAPRVSWHACANWDPPVADSEDCWAAALAGAPRPTEDVGDFLPLEGWSGTVWRERDPAGTLEEEWERVDAGDGRFLAVRCPTHGAVLVVAGTHFGFAQDSGDRGDGSARPVYAAGRVTAETGWLVEMSTDAALEGGALALCGSAAEWSVVLPGTTYAWPPGDSDELPSKPRFQSE